MSDYAIIQTFQQFRILVESTVLPLAGLGIIAFAAIRIAKIRRAGGTGGDGDLAGLEERIDRLERAVYALGDRLPEASTARSVEERLENLEALVVDRELGR